MVFECNITSLCNVYEVNHHSETLNFFYLYKLLPVLPSICLRRATQSRPVVGYVEICNSSTMFFFFQLLPSFWQIVSHRTLIIILLPTLAIFIAAAAVLTLQIIPILSLDIPLVCWQDDLFIICLMEAYVHTRKGS